MGATSYERLSDHGSRRARAWATLRRAAAGLGRLCAARRRWSSRRQARARHARVSYDSASYERNFDDGVWKAEEGVSWNAGASLSACRLGRAVSAVR